MKTRRIMSGLSCSLLMLANSLTVVAQTPPPGGPQPRPKRVTVITQDGQKQEVEAEQGVDKLIFERQVEGVRIFSPEGAVFPEVIGPGGMGATYGFFASEMSFETNLVKGVPYSAEAVTEMVQVLSDGNRIVRRTKNSVFRDSEGRTRREQTLGAVGPWATPSDTPQRIYIDDPVANVNYILDPGTKTARKVMRPQMRLPRPARGADGVDPVSGSAVVPPGRIQESVIKRVQPKYPAVAKAAGAQGVVRVKVTVSETGEVVGTEVVSGHPLLREAALEAAQAWQFKPVEVDGKAVKVSSVITFNFTLDKKNDEAQEPATQLATPPDGSIMRAPFRMENRKESLGKQMIEGVEAEGTRTVNTIPAGAIGNERPIEIVFERWFSPELKTVVLTRHSDPRSGESTYTLTNISRAEPSSSLFEVPADYTVKEDASQMRWKMEREMGRPVQIK